MTIDECHQVILILIKTKSPTNKSMFLTLVLYHSDGLMYKINAIYTLYKKYNNISKTVFNTGSSRFNLKQNLTVKCLFVIRKNKTYDNL